MKNIEFKVSLGDKIVSPGKLKNLGAVYEGRLTQRDIYFNCKKGRIKLRFLNGKKAELIFYKRADNKKSRVSNYQILEMGLAYARPILSILNQSLGKRATVEKSRELWVYKHTRIHLDRVKKLGNYLELETAIGGISWKNGMAEHLKVKSGLGLNIFKSVSESYEDLIKFLNN
ncbi:MAG: hypothetical protein A2750_03050 [Candidatus Yanofskybacteria bacterium RIFCSPHIGHO2_01_FULL_45_42]|uniref:CYTH domain-containing protein n=3 Tax=Candidatus Yanofskyibacteriota TaxID=1752733 RepID=A0A1F8F4T5_9BACT|nr:MAG: hypothetical protein A2750_03050 [Candidatus Yanofskybacteria bacterium RIFCSPHIGHO2_01_FULL_45_42]OGN16434.1 MAG: hypothetical protein A3C81_00500 [Candidatus Yanofskybacteria bacterium RIFCSPHIGHO2_02_FULL_46_19]OGN27377.1 MAG: hypothetical protein A3B17_00230 [Candidatus Yanofskybacteria bacterium RIFCSPLOWO2_01_FULL_45_72]OGN31698.1 MAG: hypothetical protein A3J01_02255 [Candidatus Yanofskybacteria bacterium RIFCSPLOWO2_02_FULL_45_18]